MDALRHANSNPVLKIYLNLEKNFAFVEFPSVELASAAMTLDNIRFEHYSGATANLRVRRPNDYRPELVVSTGPIPTFKPDVLAQYGVSPNQVGMPNSNIPSNSPDKIFVGGLPYNLTDEQVMELLSTFGPLKSFHQVREAGSITTKGYAFCEYTSMENAEAAIAALNGMELGDKRLTVKFANQNQQNNNNFGMQNQGYPAGYNATSGSMGQNTLFNSIPTRVLKLGNMVTHDDLVNDSEYDDIREDVRLECQQFGPVANVVIPRMRDGFPASAEGYIYVEFTHVETSRAAAMSLHGRKFAERAVIAQYFDEGKFANRNFY